MNDDEMDEMMEPDGIEDLDGEVLDDLAAEPDADELDADELDEEALEEDDEFAELEGDFDELDEATEDEEDLATAGPVRRSVGAEDEDEDDELLTPDDVEADLDTILKDRLVASDDEGNEDDEEPEDRAEQSDRLQPKRADESLCPSCFLLVRQSAPNCPVGDDDCPLFG